MAGWPRGTAGSSGTRLPRAAIHDLFLEKQIMDWELEARGDRNQGDRDHEDHAPNGQQSVDPLVDDIDR